MIPEWLSSAIVLIPLAAALLAAPLRSAGLAHALAATAMAAATALAVWLAWLIVPTGLSWQGPRLVWLDLGSWALSLGTMVDSQAAIMGVIVCLLATLVLIFNAWYMHDDPLAARFPWQFSFFAFAMLLVVFADNLFLAFVGWELVGLGSYLLIGFWYMKPAVADDPFYQRFKGVRARGVLEHCLSPAHAQLKAFIMNRIGDAGFLLGIGAFLAAGLAAGVRDPLQWSELQRLAAQGMPGSFLGLSGEDLLLLGCLGVFCGAIGKSAQFPLHPWLPDAMQGPTTASSIIHAATMVAAGVYLVARCYPLFPPEALLVVGIIGGFTCLLAATIASVQWDLKATLAYSTVSQLGLMFVGLSAGSEAYGREAGLGHLYAHAMSKCLLFLAAGAVIHAAGGVQDMGRLGGLARRMPLTAIVSLLAVAALIGTPFTTGFFSKDAVLSAALLHAEQRGGWTWLPFALACAGSLLTAFYMVRWWVRIFLGPERQPEITEHAHDPPGWAAAPLVVLALFTLWAPWTVREHGEAVVTGHSHAQIAAFSLIGGLIVFAVLTYAPVVRLVSCAGKPRWWQRIFSEHAEQCGFAHGQPSCTVPCGVKTAAAFAPGLLLIPWLIGYVFDSWFAPHGPDPAAAAQYHAMAIAIGLMFTGAATGLIIYWWLPRLGVDTTGFLARHIYPLYNACANLWWIDRAWHALFARGLGEGLGRLSARLDLGDRTRLAALEGAAPWRPRDLASLDGAIDGLGRICARLGAGLAAWHDGRIGAYAALAVGIASLLVIMGVLW
ncbi:MAG: proton-conducting transporter membrane subunit [Planctomycetota bacterium]|nr:proton-conducting transporter membrane subunit [Planctomycetota bacterium]